MIKNNKLIKKYILNRIPQQLPVGMTGLEALCTDLFTTYKIPDNQSMRKAIALMIVHSGSHMFTKHRLYNGLIKAMADEVCHAKMDEIIKEQKLQRKLEQQQSLQN